MLLDFSFMKYTFSHYVLLLKKESKEKKKHIEVFQYNIFLRIGLLFLPFYSGLCGEL
jgi:hypothetical protein